MRAIVLSRGIPMPKQLPAFDSRYGPTRYLVSTQRRISLRRLASGLA